MEGSVKVGWSWQVVKICDISGGGGVGWVLGGSDKLEDVELITNQ